MMCKKLLVGFMSAAMCMALLLGCGKNEASEEATEEVVTEVADTQGESDTKDEQTQAEAEPTPEVEPQVATRAIHITFTNQCGVDIGMLAVIEPTTGEQASVDPIPAGESVSLDADWPEDESEFHWALYNDDGELYMEGVTDLSVATSKATITFLGEGDVSQIQEEYE